MIEFRNVTKIYPGKDMKVTAVDNISLTVGKGEICVLLGTSGCGKTTLLRMVNRLISLTSGTIEVNGKDINSLSPIELRRSIGYVIQQTGLFPNMTIEENVCTVPKMLGWSKEKMKGRYEELMDMMGLDAKAYSRRYPWELSGGQQQRVGVARALAADPPVMLMDEPFGALDPIIRDKLQNEFLRIQENVKKTILFVSHDIDEALKLGTKIAVLQSGQVMQYGTPDEILSCPQNEFVSEFVGGDKQLKRLSLYSLQDLLVNQNKWLRAQLNHSDIKYDCLSVHDNLKTALSHVLVSAQGEIFARDDQNRIYGPITFDAFALFLGLEPGQLKSVVD